MAPATAKAPPNACKQRPTMSTDRPGASAHSNDAPANTVIPAPHTRAAAGPALATATSAAGTTATISTRLNAVNTHDTPKTVVSNRRTISGRASVTTDESARTSPTEPAHTSSRPPALRAPPRERSAPDLIRGMTSWKHPLFRLVSRMTMPRNSSRAPALGLATQR